MTSADYLEQLQQDKQDLVDNLTEMGIEDLTGEETFTELVPEVLNIEIGEDITEYFDTSLIQQQSYSSLTIGGWIDLVKKIKLSENNIPSNNMSSIFRNFKGKEIDVSEFVLNSNNNNLSQTFSSESVETITGLENWNTSNVTNMGNTFNYCKKLKSLNIKNWNTSNVTAMNSMFNYCETLIELDLSGWNTSNVTNMTSMFSSCTNLINLDISSFTSNSNLNINDWFFGTTSLQKLDIRNFEFENAKYKTDIFGKIVSGTNYRIPTNCLIIVKDNTQKNWINSNYSWLTNVQTVEEYEAL